MHLASMLSTRFVRDCNVVLALLGEELVVPDEFVQSLRASVTDADTCPPNSWNDAFDDLSIWWLVDCTGARYVDVDLEEDESQAEPQTEDTTTPKKKAKPSPAKTPHAPSTMQST